MLLHVLASLVIGALAGAIANKIMNGDPKGFFQNAFLGIIGGVVGGFLGGLIGIGGDGWLSSILLAIGGACVVVWLARKIARKYYKDTVLPFGKDNAGWTFFL